MLDCAKPFTDIKQEIRKGFAFARLMLGLNRPRYAAEFSRRPRGRWSKSQRVRAELSVRLRRYARARRWGESAYCKRMRGCECLASCREYYCGAGRSAERVGKRGIYQRVGVYVATNCQVNIHAIRGWLLPSPSSSLALDDVAKFLISTPTILLSLPKLIVFAPPRMYRVCRSRDFHCVYFCSPILYRDFLSVNNLLSHCSARDFRKANRWFSRHRVYMYSILFISILRKDQTTRNYICLCVNIHSINMTL